MEINMSFVVSAMFLFTIAKGILDLSNTPLAGKTFDVIKFVEIK